MYRGLFISIGCCLALMLFTDCKEKVEPYRWKEIEVTVTAYNSVPSQTNEQPNIAAWGDTLKPDIQSIAVSRDLLRLGIGHNTPVKIHGLEGIFYVKDKMNARFKEHIDIYMGLDEQRAREWGRRKMRISYGVKTKSSKPAQ